MSCVDCHGGDPRDHTVTAHSASFDFVGTPSAATALDRCGSCHADRSRIEPIAPELSLEVMAELRSSRHGLLVAAGDEAAPGCPDCHGSHDTRRGRDPQARVHPTRLARTCGDCHADPLRLVGHRSATTQVGRWERSAHALALLRGDDSAPSCSSCHGAHSGVPTGSPSVAARCGECHQAAASRVERSRHGAALRLVGLDPCLSCHDAHDVPPGSQLLLGLGPGSSCARCHLGDDPVRPRVQALTDAVRSARLRAADAREDAVTATRAGAFVPPSAIVQLEHAELVLRSSVHDCDAVAIEPHVSTLSHASADLQQRVRRAVTARRLVSAAPWIGSLVLALAGGVGTVALLRRRARARRKGGA